MIRDGTYSLWGIQHTDQPSNSTRRLVGKILVESGNLTHLENHFHHLDDLLPEGLLNHKHMRAIAHLLNSGYYKLENDEDVDAGHHPDSVPELSIHSGMAQAQKYKVSGGDFNGSELQVVGEMLVLNGQKLEDADTRKLLAEVESGDVVLEPQVEGESNV